MEDFERIANPPQPSSFKIFGDQSRNRDAIFRSNFQGNEGYRGLSRGDLDERIRTEGSPFETRSIQGSGGLQGVSLQGSRRYGAREATPEENEQRARQNQGRESARYNNAVGSPNSNSNNIKEVIKQGIKEGFAGQQNQNNPAQNGKIDVNNTINVVVNGHITADNAEAQNVLNEGIRIMKEYVEPRLQALEKATPSRAAVPPKVINGQPVPAGAV